MNRKQRRLTVAPYAERGDRRAGKASCTPLFRIERLGMCYGWPHVVYKLSAYENSRSNPASHILAMFCSSEDLVPHQPYTRLTSQCRSVPLYIQDTRKHELSFPSSLC